MVKGNFIINIYIWAVIHVVYSAETVSSLIITVIKMKMKFASVESGSLIEWKQSAWPFHEPENAIYKMLQCLHGSSRIWAAFSWLVAVWSCRWNQGEWGAWRQLLYRRQTARARADSTAVFLRQMNTRNTEILTYLRVLQIPILFYL